MRKLYFSDMQKNEKIIEIGLNPNLPIVLAFGGSQGARSINEALIDIIENEKNEN